jgi:hypothetical protein
MKSVELLKLLQPLTQTNTITPKEASSLAKSYIGGDNEPIIKLINSPKIPMNLVGVTKQISNFLNGGN